MKHAFAIAVVGALALAACNDAASSDVNAPACNGVSPSTLTSEQTPSGQCPQNPTTLTGTGTEGTACSDPTDCAPVCCQCPGTSQGAAVAECNGGNCLDGATVCCLYGLQCG